MGQKGSFGTTDTALPRIGSSEPNNNVFDTLPLCNLGSREELTSENLCGVGQVRPVLVEGVTIVIDEASALLQ